MYLGDFKSGSTVDFCFNTQAADGSSVTFTGTASNIYVYKDNSLTESQAGITLQKDMGADARTGVHQVRIDLTSDAFYAAGHEYDVMLIGATIDSKTVNVALRHFSIERASIVPAQLLDLANGVESGLTFRQAMRLAVAALAGKVSGAGTTTITFRNYGDTKDVIIATEDADGNRSAFTYDLS